MTKLRHANLILPNQGRCCRPHHSHPPPKNVQEKRRTRCDPAPCYPNEKQCSNHPFTKSHMAGSRKEAKTGSRWQISTRTAKKTSWSGGSSYKTSSRSSRTSGGWTPQAISEMLACATKIQGYSRAQTRARPDCTGPYTVSPGRERAGSGYWLGMKWYGSHGSRTGRGSTRTGIRSLGSSVSSPWVGIRVTGGGGGGSSGASMRLGREWGNGRRCGRSRWLRHRIVRQLAPEGREVTRSKWRVGGKW
ncbi:hypothetical protein B0H11DRAFT_1117898 [Mycena galericulata]|nr:hypothetical protein B0H11DRAFT_1117898 [Mycena galericulata]